MQIRSVFHTAPLLAALVIGLAGCTTARESYPGQDPSQVWTAMVAAAESPDYYDEWFITEEHVWVDDEANRIEIDRILERDRVIPLRGPQHEKRELEQSIYLVEGDEGEPMIEFTSRQLDVPLKARNDAQLYFDDVWEILGGRPEEPVEAVVEAENRDTGMETTEPLVDLKGATDSDGDE